MAVQRPFLRALVGDGGSGGPDILGCVVRHTFEEGFTVLVHTRAFAQDLVVAASRRRYDLFVLALANIAHRGLPHLDQDERLNRAAELVPYFRQTYRARIAIVAARPHSLDLHWLEQAGADVILPTPFTLEQFADLVGTCLTARPVPVTG